MRAGSTIRLRRAARFARNWTVFALGQAGLSHSGSRLTQDAGQYWSGKRDDHWQNDSHWHSGSKFEETGLWGAMGQEHLRLYQRLRQTASEPAPVRRIIEWGCGGGANAVAFAPLAEEVVGVDVNPVSLDECARQMALAGPTPFTKVVADITHPEQAARDIRRPFDLYLCLYVLELVPTPAYGLRLMRIAHDLLGRGGQAFVQIKYATSAWRTRPRRRSYRLDVAGTTYRIEDFWTAMESIGFRPEAVTLVPKNELDERYAYFLLSKP